LVRRRAARRKTINQRLVNKARARVRRMIRRIIRTRRTFLNMKGQKMEKMVINWNLKKMRR